MSRRKYTNTNVVLEHQVFVPYITENPHNEVNLKYSLKMALQIVIENTINTNTLYAKEIVIHNENSLIKTIKNIIKTEPVANVQFIEEWSNKFHFILCSDGHLEKSMLTQLDEDGFILFHGDKIHALDLGIPIVYQNTFEETGIFLLRNITPIKSYEVILVNNSDFLWLEKAKEYIKKEKIVFLFTQRDDVCGIVGLVKCINLEPKESASVKCVFIQERDATTFNPDLDYYNGQLFKKLTINILKNEIWGSYRHVSVKEVGHVDVAHASNYIQNIGDLSSFEWVERSSHYHKYAPESEYIFVFYSAVNDKDVMIATGQVATEKSNDTDVLLGFEYSGISQLGKKVMGITNMPSISLQVMSDPLFTWDVPTSWSLEEAATVPVVYASCYYAMIVRGGIENGKSILIHAGAGGIGIAAISIALNMNCEVFTTCGSGEKRELLLKMFSNLKPENIGNSRNTSFEQMVMRNTKGRGVDVVLNSPVADMFEASIRCVAHGGQFLGIGKVEVLFGPPISLQLFDKNASFRSVFLDNLFNETNEIKQDINRLLKEGITKGVVRPLPRTVFAEDEVEDAFRFLSTGKHKGKVLIQIRNDTSNTIQSPKRTIQAKPKIYFEPDKTYILIGGLGEVGLELTSFLIKRCAKNIVLNSRHGITNGYQSLCLKTWSELNGVTVKVNTHDTSSLDEAASLVKFAEEMGPVGGIFNMALVIQDALFVNQTTEQFNAVFKSKIYSGENMDKASREWCPKLDHFVVFSSLAAGRGKPGQSNYGMANSAMEMLCEIRRKDGLPGLAVQYGPIGEVGAIAEVVEYNRDFDTLGIVPQSISSCLSALEMFMLQSGTVGSTFVVVEQNTVFSSTSKSPAETVAHILGIKDIGLIDKNQSLLQLRLDALMIAKMKQTLYRNFNIELDIDDIRGLTFNKILKLLQITDLSNEEANNFSSANGENGHRLNIANAMLRKESVVEIVIDKSYRPTVFFTYTVEGNIDILLPLAQILHANIYGFQSTKDLDLEDFKAIATHLVKKIKHIQNKGPYFLCGYLYGGALAFEIGVQLEKQNEKVKLILINGTPSYIKMMTQHMHERGEMSEAKSKINILKTFLNTFDKIDPEKKVNQILDETIPWKEQLERLGRFVAEKSIYSIQDVIVSAERFNQRVAAIYAYEPSDIFEGKATLIWSDDVYNFPADYGLQKICKQPIKLEKLNGDHKQMLRGNNLITIADSINAILK